MFLSKCIDDKNEEVNLLSWPMTNEGDDVQVEGLHISSAETGNIHWNTETTQPVPRQLTAFEFSVEVAKMDQFRQYDSVGLKSGNKELRYFLREGKIEYDGKTITTFKGLAVNDTIQFTVRRVVVDSNTFNLCQITVNSTHCFSEVVVEGEDVYPRVGIRSTGVELNTAFGIGGSPNNEGMFTHFFKK